MDDGPVLAQLLVEAGVRVVPRGAVLLEGKLELVRLAGLNQFRIQHGHAVVAVGQQDAMPVKRHRFAGAVVHVNQGRVAFGEGERGGRNGAIGGQGVVAHAANGPGGVALTRRS